MTIDYNDFLSHTGIRFTVGDATDPQGQGKKIIVHCCNDKGAWGSGFVLALSARWPSPERAYREWARSGSWNEISLEGDETVERNSSFDLRSVQCVHVEDDIIVANLIGQHGYGKCSDPNDPFVKYDAIWKGFITLADIAKRYDASIHMPRMGCGLAGGRWEMIEPMIVSSFIENGIDVTVYDLV